MTDLIVGVLELLFIGRNSVCKNVKWADETAKRGTD